MLSITIDTRKWHKAHKILNKFCDPQNDAFLKKIYIWIIFQTQYFSKVHILPLFLVWINNLGIKTPLKSYSWVLWAWNIFYVSVRFSHSVVSNSLWPHGLQHARLPCPSPIPRAYSNSCPSSRWCHPTISSSVIPFSSHLQSFPASGSFLISHLFKSGGQSVGASALASVLPKNIQNWLPLGLTGWISLQPKGLSRVFSNTTVQKHQFLALTFLNDPTLTSIHDYWKNDRFD